MSEEQKAAPKGMVQQIIEALDTGKAFSPAELSELSGASIGTAKMQAAYLTKKRLLEEGNTRHMVKIEEEGQPMRVQIVDGPAPEEEAK